MRCCAVRRAQQQGFKGLGTCAREVVPLSTHYPRHPAPCPPPAPKGPQHPGAVGAPGRSPCAAGLCPLQSGWTVRVFQVTPGTIGASSTGTQRRGSSRPAGGSTATTWGWAVGGTGHPCPRAASPCQCVISHNVPGVPVLCGAEPSCALHGCAMPCCPWPCHAVPSPGMLFPVVPCHAALCLAMPSSAVHCHTVPCNAMLDLAVPCHTILSCAWLCHAIPHHCATPQFVMPCCTVPCCTTPCCATPACTLLCHIALCHVVPGLCSPGLGGGGGPSRWPPAGPTGG